MITSHAQPNSTCVRKSFLTAMEQLSNDFINAKVDIEQREARLKHALNELHLSALAILDVSIKKGLAENNPLTQAVENANQKIVASLEAWKNKIDRYDRNTEFRNDFGDSLLVYVYGKVKAGKSSIGNYVAYGHGDPDDDVMIKAGDPSPKFFFEKEQRKFAVGACETTATIQGFKLSGLTWIDSPGLHSKTEENGKLAQEYVNAADLILYPMSSSAPGRASDLEEIAELLKNGKRVEVVITRCDFTEEDIDDNGEICSQIVMKSEEDRSTQSEYVYKEISEIKNKIEAQDKGELNVLTVSVRYAEIHSNNSSELEQSGINNLFRKLIALTKSEGVRLKKETPIRNLRAFINNIHDGDLSIQTLQSNLCLLSENIDQQRKKLQEKKSIVISNVISELNPLIDEAVRQEKIRRDMKILERTCSDHLKRVAYKHIDAEVKEIFQETQNAVNQAINFRELKKLPEFKDLTQDIEISSKAKGGGIGALLGGVAGAALGAFGGPTGAALGFSIGSGLGGAAGAGLAGSRTERISLGDNMQDVFRETTNIVNETAENIIASAFIEMDKNFLMPVEQHAKAVDIAINRFIKILKEEVYPQ